MIMRTLPLAKEPFLYVYSSVSYVFFFVMVLSRIEKRPILWVA